MGEADALRLLEQPGVVVAAEDEQAGVEVFFGGNVPSLRFRADQRDHALADAGDLGPAEEFGRVPVVERDHVGVEEKDVVGVGEVEEPELEECGVLQARGIEVLVTQDERGEAGAEFHFACGQAREVGVGPDAYGDGEIAGRGLWNGSCVRSGEGRRGRIVVECAAFVVEVDGVDDTGGGDNRHTLPDLRFVARGYGVGAEVKVGGVAVADGLAPSFPAAAVGAAVERPDGVKELVTGIGFPVRRFASAGNHHAGSERRRIGARRDSRGQVHGQRDRAEHAIRVVNQADELAERRASDEVGDTSEGGVKVIAAAALDEMDPAFEVVYDRLVVRRAPPLGSEVVLAPGDDDPVRTGVTGFCRG